MENRIKQFAYSISQSATLTALFTKESLATRSVGNADLQPKKRAKESLFYDFYIELRQQINISKNPQRCRPLVKGGGFSRRKTGGIDFDE